MEVFLCAHTCAGSVSVIDDHNNHVLLVQVTHSPFGSLQVLLRELAGRKGVQHGPRRALLYSGEAHDSSSFFVPQVRHQVTEQAHLQARLGGGGLAVDGALEGQQDGEVVRAA